MLHHLRPGHITALRAVGWISTIRNRPLPFRGAVYFRLSKESINTTNVANEIISVKVWNTSTGITSLYGRLADRPYKP
jgi:hypothetical protein